MKMAHVLYTEVFANTFSGYWAGYSNIDGINNTFSGYGAGVHNTTGDNNTFSGFQAGYSNTYGIYNTFSGFQAGYSNTGSVNTFFGEQAGVNNTTGNNDVYIHNLGPLSGTESNTIRIGGDLGYGNLGPQTAAYIAGIWNSSVGVSGVGVYVDAYGQLGTYVSSRRFKEQIRDMGDSTNGLMKLRPVTFLYKPEYDKGQRTVQYGLIAEEVAEVYPELVAYELDGQPYTVKYQYLTTMLLNEVQKQYRRAEAEADLIKSQKQKIESLEQRLLRLEKLIGASSLLATSSSN